MEQPIVYGIYALARFLRQRKDSVVFVLCDQHTKKLCLPLLQPYLKSYHLIQIKSGESNKTLDTATIIWRALLRKQADRNALLINLGGGVITDLGGFSAATYKRGIDFVNIPTTLLAMADAAIGGKTGVDFDGYKNFIGGFHLPVCTIIEPVFLNTLPLKQLSSGAAEVFKHALLQNAILVNAHLEMPFSQMAEKERTALIKQAVKFKLSIVAGDLNDKGVRKQLNLGHTIGHALESYFLEQGRPILHGEAVALGLVAEGYLAHNYYGLTYNVFLKIIFWYDLNYRKPNLLKVDIKRVFELMSQDKKNSNGAIKMVLLQNEGMPRIDMAVSKEEIMEALKFMVAF